MNFISEGAFRIKKYLIMALLIFGLTLSMGVYGASAATTSTGDSYSGLKHYEGSSTVQHSTSSSTNSKTVVSTGTKKIKVLIYSGKGAIASCVNGVRTGLHAANDNNLVPGYCFVCYTTRTINRSILSNYDVLVMPGGSSGKTYINSVSGSAIRNFVASGHGYLGICAGGYSGSSYVSGMYRGWGVAPHVYCKHVTHEGNLKINIMQSGSKLFGTSSPVILAHYNGPVMYPHGGSVVNFASYGDKYKGYLAIVGDYYHLGRAVLSGPHPELDPQHPDILAKIVAWADKVPVSNYITVTSSSPVNGAVNVAANKVINISFSKSIKLGNGNINLVNSAGTPVKIYKSINGNVLSISHSLLSKGVRYTLVLHSGSLTDLAGKGIKVYSTSFRVSSLTLAQMKYGLSKVQNFYNTHNRLPNYVTIGTKQFTIAQFQQIISAYNLKVVK